MEPFTVTLDKVNGYAKDPHPLPILKKPVSFDKDVLEKYKTDLLEWEKIDQTLKRYKIENLMCDSGEMWKAEHISFYVGENRLAHMLENGNINISSIKKK